MLHQPSPSQPVAAHSAKSALSAGRRRELQGISSYTLASLLFTQALLFLLLSSAKTFASYIMDLAPAEANNNDVECTASGVSSTLGARPKIATTNVRKAASTAAPNATARQRPKASDSR